MPQLYCRETAALQFKALNVTDISSTAFVAKMAEARVAAETCPYVMQNAVAKDH